MLQVNRQFYNLAMTEILELEQKLERLLVNLRQMEKYESVITRRRIESDMGDDYKENEQAKLVMEQHDIWYIRKVALKKEIALLKTEIIKLKKI